MKNPLSNNRKPEWTPKNAGAAFSTEVMPGIDSSEKNKSKYRSNKKNLFLPDITIEDYYNGLINDNRTMLARAITLIESNSSLHAQKAQELLKLSIPRSGNSLRIGITGAPGAGKSTFIESFGSYLCQLGYKVAVLAIDPSSTRSKGSILGDKTRMERLSQNKNAFIRPSPSGGTMGGVARKTRETMLLCEAAGFDVILVETIGAGQSEVTVRSMVDFYMLLLLPGEGDELQGLKKGTVELADMILVNKADGDNQIRAEATKSLYQSAVHYLRSATEGWDTKVLTCSALNETGIDDIWDIIKQFEEMTKKSNVLFERRKSQLLEWVHSMVNETLNRKFYNNPEIQQLIPKIEKSLINGQITPTVAADTLLKSFKWEY